MAAPKPFKLDRYDVGAAAVIDRETGERVGYVLDGSRMENRKLVTRWWAFIGPYNGRRVELAHKYQADAAQAVWDHVLTARSIKKGT